MNWQHLRAILWLRWRMSINQLKRGGIASTIILSLLGISVLGIAVTMFFVALLVGMFALPQAPADTVMFLWDGIVVAFVFFWMIGLLTELQRSEVLSLQKLLHLPISLTGTFLINYLGSLLSLSIVVFLPGMIGLSIALVMAKGPALLMVFPLLAGFLLMVTAVTYQFQGWLAALMTNQRRRRTVIAFVTLFFVLFFQLPNLLNILFSRGTRDDGRLSNELQQRISELDRARTAGEINDETYNKGRDEAAIAYKSGLDEENRQKWQRIVGIVTRVNLVLPIGWLPYGAMTSVDGRILPALLCTFGAGLVGAASLWRSYRTTLRLYTGQFNSGTARRVQSLTDVRPLRADVSWLERRLPGCSEHASAIALASFRSLMRAPEAKMLLLTPAIMVIVFGSLLLTRRMDPPEMARPFMGFGAVVMIMLTVMQLIANQFGLDRQGFRTLVLSASPRRDIVLGKNLSVAPLALGLSLLSIALLQAVYPMRISHLLATILQLGSLYLVSCMVGNLTSILAPMPVTSGSLKPAHPKAMTVVVQLLFFFLFPVVYGVALTPLGIELLLHHFGWFTGVPIYLACAVVGLAIVMVLYYFVIGWQGRLLGSREQKILTIVTAKVE